MNHNNPIPDVEYDDAARMWDSFSPQRANCETPGISKLGTYETNYTDRHIKYTDRKHTYTKSAAQNKTAEITMLCVNAAIFNDFM